VVRVHPFHGHLVAEDWVLKVPAPAFDAMSPAERVRYLDAHPFSYTLVTRSPGDGGPLDDSSPEELIELGAEALRHIVDAGAFNEIEGEAYFLLRLTLDGHSEVGIVALVDGADYVEGHVKRHERINHGRAVHLSNHFESVGAMSAPIALGYRRDESLSSLVAEIVASTEPVLDFTTPDELGQAVWVISDPEHHRLIADVLATQDAYIMDGHHRAAAAGELYKRVGTNDSGRMLAVLFADNKIHIEPFHRWVRVPLGKDLQRVEAQLRDTLDLWPDDTMDTTLPDDVGGVGVWMARQWWQGTLPVPATDDALAAIDPVRLQRSVIGPILGIDPEAPGTPMGYFLEKDDRRELAAHDDDQLILFVLRAVTPAEVFAVADSGLDMPPKSTYVTPKPRSGVFLRRF